MAHKRNIVKVEVGSYEKSHRKSAEPWAYFKKHTMDICNTLMTIGSVIIGGLITWFFSWRYYLKAGQELIAETIQIRKLINGLIILQQDEKGQFKLKLDSEGKLITIIGILEGNVKGGSTLSGYLESK